MNQWVPIRYRGFYDVPRNFLVVHQGAQYLFSCPFDEDRDEYPETYQVYLLPSLTEQDLEGDWEELPEKATQQLGEIPVAEIKFDATRRKEIDATILESLLAAVQAKVR